MYVQCFDFEIITFEKAVNMFERMEISEFFMKVLQNLIIKTNREYANRAGHRSKMRV